METLDKTKTYIAAVSFGPDSMALLSMLIKEKIKVVVCFVNYHKRIEAEQEEEGIIKFCKENKIKLHILHADTAPKHVNFQAWARDIRYRFFKEIYDKYKAYALLVAHHKDDDLETFLMQKKKLLRYYGIMPCRTIYDMRVIRPLLGYRKKELKDYCISNNIPFAIDDSNNHDDYERNRIRHTRIEKATREEIDALIEEKNSLNKTREKQFENILKVFDDNTICISKFLLLNEEEQILCLHYYINLYVNEYTLSKYKAKMMIQAALSKKPNWKMVLTPPYQLIKAYDLFYICRAGENDSYEYLLEKPCKLDTPYFRLDFEGDTSNRNVFDYDYPLIIRNYRAGDCFEVGGVRKSVKRLFLDWKMPTELRKKWPIIVNSKDKIVYIPRYRNTFVDDGNNNFVVKSKLGI